jgi:catalase
MPVPKGSDGALNRGVPADGIEADFQPRLTPKRMPPSPALSMENKASSRRGGIKTRRIAILATDGVDGGELSTLEEALSAAGATGVVVSTRVGSLTTDKGRELKIDASLLNTGSVLYDAVFVPGGKRSVAALVEEPRAVRFVEEAFGHAKAIGASGDGTRLLAAAGVALGEASLPPGVVGAALSGGSARAKRFIEAVAAHRHWEREERPVRPIARR